MKSPILALATLSMLAANVANATVYFDNATPALGRR